MNKIINLYIPDWFPIAHSDKQIKKTFKSIENFRCFKWEIAEDDECNKEQIQTFMKMESLSDQLKNYFKNHKNETFNIIIDSFSQLIFFQIYEEIKEYVNKIILINPFDKSIYLRFVNMKSKMLPINQVEVINKYIYLSNSLNRFREDQEWLSAIRKEVKFFSDTELLYHKLFDQILRYSLFKKYFKWLDNAPYNLVGIISKKNPLIICNQKHYQFTTKVIEGSGYCLLWESPEKLITVIKSLM